VRVIKLTQAREITPYLWVHPDEERCGRPARLGKCDAVLAIGRYDK
jgi:hypothetical protein